MKNIFLIALFLICNTFSSQKLSDYKYVYVSKNMKKFENNKYNLTNTLEKNLKTKGYEVLQTEENSWPNGLSQNPCEVAIINIVDTGNFFTNKLTIEAEDCHNKVFFSTQGSSSEKDFAIGFMEALQKDLVNIPNSVPTNNFAAATENKVEKTEPIVEKSQTNSQKEQNSEATISNNSQNYFNGNLMLQKILIGNGQFILVNKNSSVPYATFTESGKKDVFHVVLENGSMTLGYLENGNYSIEMPNKDGSFTKEVFEKK